MGKRRRVRSGNAVARPGNPARFAAEPLESRTLLSISTVPLIEPYFEAGNHYEYAGVDSSGNTNTLYETTAGPDTFNGIACYRIDIGPSGQSHSYIGDDGNGDYVGYGGTIALPRGTSTSVFSPYELGLPMTMTAGQPYSATDTDTTTDSSDGSTTTATDTYTFTLKSESTVSVTVPLGTYDCYDITTTDTEVTNNADGTTTTDTTSNEDYYAAGIGPVKTIAYDDTGAANGTFSLSVFGPAPDHLAFAAPVPNGAAAMPLKPAVVVDLDGSDGKPKADDNGTVITLAAIGFNERATITGNTAATVNGVATFPDLTFPKKGVYTIQATDAAADPAATSTKFVISGGTLNLTINSRSPHKTNPGVASGDIIFYDLNVSSKNPIQSSVITDTLPAGFTPTDINDGGVFANNVITWTTTDHDVSFQMTVPGADALAKLKSITTAAHVTSTYTDTTTDDADATDTVKIAGSLKVTGTLHDAQFQFPAKLSVATPALGGITVNLIDPSDGSTIDTAKTARNGTFTVTAAQPGDYTVQFDAVVPTYSSASNGLSSSHAYAGQPVTIPPGNTKPIKVGDLYLPVTFFTTASKVLNSLNNYTTSGFQNLPAAKLDLFQFDTTGPEATIHNLLGSAASPSPLLNVKSLKIGGPTDPWVAAMRAVAALATVDSRFTDTYRLADQTGKALSVIASAAFSAALGKLAATKTQAPFIYNALGPGFRLSSVSAVTAKLAQATRVAGLTTLGAVLPSLLDAAGVPAAKKGAILGVVFNLARYGSDLFTGRLIDDLGFEAVFNLFRITADAAILETLTGVQLRLDLPSPYAQIGLVLNSLTGELTIGNFQDAVAESATLAYNTNTDTEQVLSALDKYDGTEHNLVAKVQAATASFNTVGGILRGGDGALNLQKIAQSINPSLSLGGYQSALQSVLTKSQSAIQSVLGTSTAALQAQAAELTFATAAAGLTEQALAATFIPNLAANSVLVGTALARPAADRAAPHAAPAIALRPDAAGPSADAAAYLADLAKLSTLVKQADTAGLETLYPTLAADDSALFDADLVPLDQQASAVLAQVPAKGRPTLARFDTNLNAAINAGLLTTLQVQTWAADPKTGSAAAVLRQIAATVGAVRAALTGQSAPAALTIDETSVPPSAAVGTAQTFTVTITNDGAAGTDAGTVTFANDDGALVVQGPAQQPLAALDPGASATVTYQVDVIAPSNGDTSAAYQLTAAAGAASAEVTDSVTLG